GVDCPVVNRSGASTGLGTRPARGTRLYFSAGIGGLRFVDAVGSIAEALVASGIRFGICIRGVRQHSPNGAGVETGWIRLGFSCLRGRVRRLDAMVWIVRGRGDL